MADSPPPAPDAPQAPQAPQSVTTTPALTSLQARITELGQQENDRIADLRRKREDFRTRGERLLKEVPPRFFDLCTGLRDAVSRFNAEITEDDPALPLRYEETPGVTLREIDSDDLRVTVSRKFARFDLRLRMMSRAGKPAVPIIEGDGTYGAQHVRRVLVRVEGWVEGGKTIYWYSLDFKRQSIDLAEVPARIVMSVIQVDPAPLSRVRLVNHVPSAAAIPDDDDGPAAAPLAGAVATASVAPGGAAAAPAGGDDPQGGAAAPDPADGPADGQANEPGNDQAKTGPPRRRGRGGPR